jgi:hypothetical protein
MGREVPLVLAPHGVFHLRAGSLMYEIDEREIFFSATPARTEQRSAK